MDDWICSCCGEKHSGIANSFAFDAPAGWGDRNRLEPPSGCWINDDYCVIDRKHFYVRATLEIPVLGSDEVFVFGVWSSLSRTNFDRERDLALSPMRVNEPGYFGWFSNRIWQYPDTLHLKCNLHSRKPGQRPYTELEPTGHPLAVDLRTGISRKRFVELSEQCLHGWKHPESGL